MSVGLTGRRMMGRHRRTGTGSYIIVISPSMMIANLCEIKRKNLMSRVGEIFSKHNNIERSTNSRMGDCSES